MSAVLTKPPALKEYVCQARLEIVNGRRWWKCPNCGRTLGEISSGKLIVKFGDRFIRLPIIVGTEQDCPRCGETSELEVAK